MRSRMTVWIKYNRSSISWAAMSCEHCKTGVKESHEHMGTFPEGQNYLSAAGENRDIGTLWMGLSLTDRILLFIDL